MQYQNQYSNLLEAKKGYQDLKLLKEKRIDEYSSKDDNEVNDCEQDDDYGEDDENEDESCGDGESTTEQSDNVDGSQSFFTTQDTNFEADISNLTSFSQTMDSISILHWNE